MLLVKLFPERERERSREYRERFLFEERGGESGWLYREGDCLACCMATLKLEMVDDSNGAAFGTEEMLEVSSRGERSVQCTGLIWLLAATNGTRKVCSHALVLSQVASGRTGEDFGWCAFKKFKMVEAAADLRILLIVLLPLQG